MTNDEYVKELRKIFKAITHLDISWLVPNPDYFRKYGDLVIVLIRHTESELNKFGVYND